MRVSVSGGVSVTVSKTALNTSRKTEGKVFHGRYMYGSKTCVTQPV